MPKVERIDHAASHGQAEDLFAGSASCAVNALQPAFRRAEWGANELLWGVCVNLVFHRRSGGYEMRIDYRELAGVWIKAPDQRKFLTGVRINLRDHSGAIASPLTRG